MLCAFARKEYFSMEVSMSDRYKPRKPRIKASKRVYEFWCFYHKRFFDESKKFGHCIPKQCFEFNQEHYLERMGMKQAA